MALAYIDYPKKEIGAIDYIALSGDAEADMALIRTAYQGHLGRYPELAAPITWSH